jgi:hypothetical protein
MNAADLGCCSDRCSDSDCRGHRHCDGDCRGAGRRIRLSGRPQPSKRSSWERQSTVPSLSGSCGSGVLALGFGRCGYDSRWRGFDLTMTTPEYSTYSASEP